MEDTWERHRLTFRDAVRSVDILDNIDNFFFFFLGKDNIDNYLHMTRSYELATI